MSQRYDLLVGGWTSDTVYNCRRQYPLLVVGCQRCRSNQKPINCTTDTVNSQLATTPHRANSGNENSGISSRFHRAFFSLVP